MFTGSIRSHRETRREGFTLLELIVVITIIGILSTIVVVSTRNLPARGRRVQVDSDLRNIHKVATAIFTDTGRWPESIEEMVGDKSADGKLRIAALEKMPKDPWGHEYLYEIVDGNPRVTCLGYLNEEGGEGESEDVIYPEPQNQ
jgi:general secretion pathway protein G